MAEQEIATDVENGTEEKVSLLGPDVSALKNKSFLGMKPVVPTVQYRNFYPDGGGEENFKFIDPQTGDPEGGYNTLGPTQRRVMSDGTLGDADPWGDAAVTEQKLREMVREILKEK